MTDFVQLIGKGAEFAGFGEDVEAIEAIVAMAAKWASLDPKPTGFPSVEALLEAALADVDSDAVKAAFATLGAEAARAKVAALLGKVNKAVGSVPAWVKTLLSPVSGFSPAAPGVLSWEPLAADKSLGLGAGISLGFSGKAVLGLSAGAVWPGGDAGANDSGGLLRIGAHGELGAKAGAAIPYSLGAVKADGSAGMSVDLGYYYDLAGSGVLYGVAVAERVPLVPNPFDFASVWEAAQRADFAGAVFEFKGNAQASVALSLAYSGVPLAGVNVDLGATVSVGASFARGYRLAVRRADANDLGGGLAVEMSRSALDANTLGVSIGVTVALPALAAKVQKFLTQAIETWDGELEKVKPFLSPGTYLQDQLGGEIGKAAARLVKDPGLRAAVVRDLSGVFGIDASDESAVADWLETMLRGAVDAKSAALIGDVKAAAEAAYGELAGSIPAFAQPEIKALLTNELAALSGKAKDAVTGVVDGLFKTVDLKKLGKALGAAGAASDKVVASLDDALARVREVLTKYNGLLHDVVAKAQEAATKKLTIAIQADNARSRTLDVRVSGRFTGNTPAAAAVFRRFAAGDLEALALIASGADNPADFVLDAANSSSKLSLLRKGSIGAEVVAFGLGAKFSSAISASVDVEIDGFGNVRIATQGEMKKLFSGNGEERELSFADSIGLAYARKLGESGPPPISASVEMGVSVIYRDEELRRDELAAFTAGLRASGLVAAEVDVQAQAALARWALPEVKPPVDMSAKLWLEGDAAVKALCLDRREGGKLTEAARLDLIARALAALRAGDAINTGLVKTALQKLRKGQESEAETIFRLPRNAVQHEAGGFGPHNPVVPDVKYFLQVHDMLRGFVRLIDAAGEAYLSTPAGSVAGPGEWTADMYLDAQNRIASGSRGWLSTGQVFIFWARKGMGPRTVVMMKLLRELAGDPADAVKVVLTHRPASGAPETLALG